jgi:hypothetical protein
VSWTGLVYHWGARQLGHAFAILFNLAFKCFVGRLLFASDALELVRQPTNNSNLSSSTILDFSPGRKLQPTEAASFPGVPRHQTINRLAFLEQRQHIVEPSSI